jgi:hypothetical protein
MSKKFVTTTDAWINGTYYPAGAQVPGTAEMLRYEILNGSVREEIVQPVRGRAAKPVEDLTAEKLEGNE